MKRDRVSLKHASAVSMVFGVLATSLVARTAFAQSSGDDEWNFVVEPYVFLSSISGTVGLDSLPYASIDQSATDLFRHLQFAAMFYSEAHNGSWAIASDFSYANLAQDTSGSALISYGRAELKQVIWEPAVLYRLTPYLEFGLGAQLVNLDSRLNLTLNTPFGQVSRSAEASKTWVDPTLNFALTIPLAQDWALTGRANVGGFGSQFNYDAQLFAGYQISGRLALSFGYRVIDMQYRSGSGLSRFVYNSMLFGPQIGLTFTF